MARAEAGATYFGSFSFPCAQITVRPANKLRRPHGPTLNPSLRHRPHRPSVPVSFLHLFGLDHLRVTWSVATRQPLIFFCDARRFVHNTDGGSPAVYVGNLFEMARQIAGKG